MRSLVAVIDPLFLQMITSLSTLFRRQLKVQEGKPHTGMKLTREAPEDWKTPSLAGKERRRRRPPRAAIFRKICLCKNRQAVSEGEPLQAKVMSPIIYLCTN